VSLFFSPGRERVRTVVLQGHLDMVCEKNKEKVHDFTKDPIELVRKGNFLMANGTTLGADNGIAVATNLAIMEDKSLVHGPLEFLFTIDEETGLTGAAGLVVRRLEFRDTRQALSSPDNLDEARFDALVGTKRAEVEKLVADKKAMIEKQITMAQSVVNEKKAMVDAKKQELTDRRAGL